MLLITKDTKHQHTLN